MSIWHLICREIQFRPIGFALSLLSAVVAVGCLVGQLILLQQNDVRSEHILAAKRALVEKLGKEEWDIARKQTLKLGFNLRILPKGFDPLQFYEKDYVEKYMPESNATKLANSKVITVNHLLPTLQERVHWNELGVWIDLVGTRGEIPIKTRKKKGKELEEAVPKGRIILGYGIHHDHLAKKKNNPVKVGDEIELLGRKFTIHKLYPQRNGRDNLTAWIHLSEAQQMLNREGKINGILALGCDCTAGRLANIRNEVNKILPETQVEEYLTKAVVRAEVRNAATKRAQADLERTKEFQATLRTEKEQFAAMLIPILVLGCCVWIGILAWDNVNRRKTEIGVLRALGLRSSHLLMVFLGRALIVGVVGACIGFAAGAMFGAQWALSGQTLFEVVFFTPILLPAVLVAAPLLSAAACWLPSLAAIRQDPASVLQPD